MRVGFLERALKPAKKRASTDDLNRSRKDAEFDARHKALMDYYKQKKIEYYLRNPEVLAKDLALERELADFFRIEPTGDNNLHIATILTRIILPGFRHAPAF